MSRRLSPAEPMKKPVHGAAAPWTDESADYFCNAMFPLESNLKYR
jgi:hypothetical protein